MSDFKYSVVIKWSEEDQAFVAKVPELPGCMADGSSQIEALNNLKEVISMWIDVVKEHNDPIPEPVFLSEEDI